MLPNQPPDSAFLYSVDDIASLARVTKARIFKYVAEGGQPQPIVFDGRKYWTRPQLIELIQALGNSAPPRKAA